MKLGISKLPTSYSTPIPGLEFHKDNIFNYLSHGFFYSNNYFISKPISYTPSTLSPTSVQLPSPLSAQSPTLSARKAGGAEAWNEHTESWREWLRKAETTLGACESLPSLYLNWGRKQKMESAKADKGDHSLYNLEGGRGELEHKEDERGTEVIQFPAPLSLTHNLGIVMGKLSSPLGLPLLYSPLGLPLLSSLSDFSNYSFTKGGRHCSLTEQDINPLRSSTPSIHGSTLIADRQSKENYIKTLIWSPDSSISPYDHLRGTSPWRDSTINSPLFKKSDENRDNKGIQFPLSGQDLYQIITPLSDYSPEAFSSLGAGTNGISPIKNDRWVHSPSIIINRSLLVSHPLSARTVCSPVYHPLPDSSLIKRTDRGFKANRQTDGLSPNPCHSSFFQANRQTSSFSPNLFSSSLFHSSSFKINQISYHSNKGLFLGQFFSFLFSNYFSKTQLNLKYINKPEQDIEIYSKHLVKEIIQTPHRFKTLCSPRSTY